MSPLPNCWVTPVSRTPLPMAVELRLRPVDENTSAKSAREPLKPTVLVLAMLLAVTSRSEDAALSPLRAMLKGMWVCSGGRSEDLRDLIELHAADTVDLHVGAVAGVADACHLPADVRGERRVGIAGRQGVGAGRDGLAAGVQSVPLEFRETRGLRAEVERAHGVAAGVDDADLQVVGWVGHIDRTRAAGLPGGQADLARRHQDLAADEVGGIQHLVALQGCREL